MSIEKPKIAALCCILVAVALTAAGLGSTAWIVGNDVSQGLFQICASGVCVSRGSSTFGFEKATIAFLFLALFALVGAFVAAFFMDKFQRGPTILCVVAVVCIIIACATYIGKSLSLNSSLSFGWGFVVPWIAIPFTIAAAIILGRMD